jgi:MIP family channel proteins
VTVDDPDPDLRQTGFVSKEALSMATQSSMGIMELTSPTALKAAAAELIATALFIMVSIGSIAAVTAQGSDALPTVALTFGLSIAMLAAGIGGISGGHINPAVTFAMIITGQISVAKGSMYIVAQLIGACIGALILRAFLVDDLLATIPGGGGDFINDGAVSEAWHGMLLESMGTFVLVWTVFAVAVNPRLGSGNVAPLYIGLAVGVVHFFLIPLTGCGINPARTFGPALFLPATVDGVPGRWDKAWIYYIGPLLGAAAAALTYYMLYLTPSRSELTRPGSN